MRNLNDIAPAQIIEIARLHLSCDSYCTITESTKLHNYCILLSILHCVHCMYCAFHALCITCIRHNHTHHVGTTQVYYYQQYTFETRYGPNDIANYRASIAVKDFYGPSRKPMDQAEGE